MLWRRLQKVVRSGRPGIMTGVSRNLKENTSYLYALACNIYSGMETIRGVLKVCIQFCQRETLIN